MDTAAPWDDDAMAFNAPPSADDPLPDGSIAIYVGGTPRPQGSKEFKGRDGRGRAILVESSTYVKGWRQDIVAKLTDARGRPRARIDGPVAVECLFIINRPLNLKKPNGLILAKGNPDRIRQLAATVTPDICKTLRAVHDAVTSAGVIVDDAYVTRVCMRKRRSLIDERGRIEAQGTHIWISEDAHHFAEPQPDYRWRFA